MLKFRTKEGRAAGRPPNYLGHRFQRPWILGLFVIAGGVWLLRGGDPSKLSGMLHKEKADKLALADGPIKDNVLDRPAPVLKQGEVQAPGPRPLNPVEGKRLFHNVKPELFTQLEDDAVYRNAERNSLFTLFKTLEEADQRDLGLASVGHRNFRQLSEQSDEYRGEIVTVAGTVRRIIPQKPEANPQGIEKFFEVWIEPVGSRLPILVDVLEMPKDYPVGGNFEQYIEATGFYYKRLGYPSEPDPRTKKEVFRSAPVVLAKTLQWTPQADANVAVVQAGQQALEDMPGVPKGWAMPLLGIGIVVMIFLAVWSFRLSRSSVLDRGPIVGRLRREAEEARNPVNLNKLKIDP